MDCSLQIIVLNTLLSTAHFCLVSQVSVLCCVYLDWTASACLGSSPMNLQCHKYVVLHALFSYGSSCENSNNVRHERPSPHIATNHLFLRQSPQAPLPFCVPGEGLKASISRFELPMCKVCCPLCLKTVVYSNKQGSNFGVRSWFEQIMVRTSNSSLKLVKRVKMKMEAFRPQGETHEH